MKAYLSHFGFYKWVYSLILDMQVCECLRSFSNVGRYVQISRRCANVPLKYTYFHSSWIPVCLAQPLVLQFSGKRYLYRSEIPNQCHLLSLPPTIRQVPQVHRLVQLVRLRFLDLLLTNWVFLSLLDVFQVRTFHEITCDLLPIYFPCLIWFLLTVNGAQ